MSALHQCWNLTKPRKVTVSRSEKDKRGCYTETWRTGVVLAKLECANPTGSVKDRIAKQLLEGSSEKTSRLQFRILWYHAERDNATNASNERATLIVPTSGNFGLAIAGLAAKRGNYRVVAVIPERTTNDRIQMLKALGAEIMRTPNEARPEAPESSYSVAARLAGQLKDAIVMDEVWYLEHLF